MKDMSLRTLALGLFSFLALAGCARNLVVKGEYNFADHPGKALIAISTRMDAGKTCPDSAVGAAMGFRMSPLSAAGASKSYSSVDARILFKEPRPDALTLAMRTPLPERTVPIYSMDSTYADMGTAETRVIPAEPPTSFVVAEVPAGRYTLNSVTLKIQGGLGFYTLSEPPSYAFTVKEGEVVYLGELGVMLDRKDCTLWEGRPSPLSGWWTVHNEWARDEARFKAEIHNISPEAVQKRLLTESLED